MKPSKITRAIEGRHAWITWVDDGDDYPWYRVLRVWPKRGRIEVQGVAGPGTSTGGYQGGAMVVPIADIRRLRVLP